ncbi:MAG: hypothetical protein J0H55_04640, partial [Chitinophagaceae bacterium]|nr:hypothetical protein [Chitinophagaceae bacterium]
EKKIKIPGGGSSARCFAKKQKMAEQNLQIQNFPKVKVKIAIRFRVCEIWEYYNAVVRNQIFFNVRCHSKK